MKKINSKCETLLREGVKVTGNFKKALCYIEESLTPDEYKDIDQFTTWLDDNARTFGWNLKSVWAEWIAEMLPKGDEKQGNLQAIMKEMDNLSRQEVQTIKDYADGLMSLNGSKSLFVNNPEDLMVGDEKEIESKRDGHYTIKILKVNRKKVLAQILKVISIGTRLSTSGWEVGMRLTVPKTMLKVD